MYEKFIFDFAAWLNEWLRANAELFPQVINLSSRARYHAEDVKPIDTSFFCTERFTPDIIEKNLRQSINLASSKADACRRIMALETCGYIVLSNVSDERKAELINPFAEQRFVFCGDDFVKARSRGKS